MKTSNVIYLSAFVSTLVLALAFAVTTLYPKYQRSTAKIEDKQRVGRCFEMHNMVPSRIESKVCEELESHYKRTYFESAR